MRFLKTLLVGKSFSVLSHFSLKSISIIGSFCSVDENGNIIIKANACQGRRLKVTKSSDISNPIFPNNDNAITYVCGTAPVEINRKITFECEPGKYM